MCFGSGRVINPESTKKYIECPRCNGSGLDLIEKHYVTFFHGEIMHVWEPTRALACHHLNRIISDITAGEPEKIPESKVFQVNDRNNKVFNPAPGKEYFTLEELEKMIENSFQVD